MSQRRAFDRAQLAASLVADDRQSDEQIASEVGITRRTLTRWRGDPAFRARVQAIKDRYAEELAGRGIADRQNRLDALNRDFQATETLLAERGAAEELRQAPGGRTGFVVRTLKVIGSGESAEVVEEFSFDRALLEARLAIGKQAAVETGQWTEKREVKGDVDVLVREYVGVDLDRLTGKTRDAGDLHPAGGGAEAVP